MFIKGQFLQFLGSITCVAATVGGGYYCFNERKGESLDSLNASNLEEQESAETFLPLFSFEQHDEKIDLKEKASGLITMAKFLNKNIEKLDSNNLSNLRNVKNISDLDKIEDFSSLETANQLSDVDEDSEEGDSNTKTDVNIQFTDLVTQLVNFKDDSDSGIKTAYEQLENKKTEINNLLEKIRNLSNTSQQQQ